jgi:hypothetical protein
MVMARATALTMPSVHRTQTELSKLPAEAASGGFQLAANMFGGVINLGALAVLSAAVPANANLQRRKLGAEATLRGMVTEAAWPPFFVAFAVGQSFTDPLNSWIAIAMGSLDSSFKCNTSRPLGIGCCDGHTKQAPQQRGPWRDISRA